MSSLYSGKQTYRKFTAIIIMPVRGTVRSEVGSLCPLGHRSCRFVSHLEHELQRYFFMFSYFLPNALAKKGQTVVLKRWLSTKNDAG